MNAILMRRSIACSRELFLE